MEKWSPTRWLLLAIGSIAALLALVVVTRPVTEPVAASAAAAPVGVASAAREPMPLELASKLAPAPAESARAPASIDPNTVELHLHGRVVTRDGAPVAGVRVLAVAFELTPQPTARRRPSARASSRGGAPQPAAPAASPWPDRCAPLGRFLAARESAANGEFELALNARPWTQTPALAVRICVAGAEASGGPLVLLTTAEQRAQFYGAQPLGVEREALDVSAGRAALGDLALLPRDRFVCAGSLERVSGGALDAARAEFDATYAGATYVARAGGDAGVMRSFALQRPALGRFEVYADVPWSGALVLRAKYPQLPATAPLVTQVGNQELALRFEAWSSASGRVRLDPEVAGGSYRVVAAKRTDAAVASDGPGILRATLGPNGEFEFGELGAGRYALSLRHEATAQLVWECGEFELGWGERESNLDVDLRGAVRLLHVELLTPAGQLASGWACYDAPDSRPFGFERVLVSHAPQGATRIDVYVPGHRCKSIALPLRAAVERLEPGPRLDLGLSARRVASAAERGWSYELVPVALADSCARSFAEQMRLLPLWAGARVSIALPSPGTYELRAVSDGRRAFEPRPQSVLIEVPEAGVAFDP